MNEDISEEEKNDLDANITIPNILPKIRNLVMKDRDLPEKGTKDFTPYVAPYKKSNVHSSSGEI